MMTREEFISKAKTGNTKAVDVPDFGTVYVRKVTARQYNRIINLGMAMKNGSTEKFYSEQVAYFLCDENGKRLFNDNQIDQIAELDGDIIAEIVNAGFEYNGLGSLKEEIEEAEKNLEPTQ